MNSKAKTSIPNPKSKKSPPQSSRPATKKKTQKPQQKKTSKAPRADTKERAYSNALDALCCPAVPDGEFNAFLVFTLAMPAVCKELRLRFERKFKTKFGHEWSGASSAEEFER
jgi:hypothetical protein